MTFNDVVDNNFMLQLILLQLFFAQLTSIEIKSLKLCDNHLKNIKLRDNSLYDAQNIGACNFCIQTLIDAKLNNDVHDRIEE